MTHHTTSVCATTEIHPVPVCGKIHIKDLLLRMEIYSKILQIFNVQKMCTSGVKDNKLRIHTGYTNKKP